MLFSFLNPVTEQYIQSVATKTVTQFKGIKNVTGSSFADTITGNSADNRIDAGAGRDIINGGDGADTIISGRGQDQISGGEGPDRFVFNDFLDSSQFNALSSVISRGVCVEGVDTIRDFLVGSDTDRPLRHRRQFHHIRQSGVRVVDPPPPKEFTGHAGEVGLVEISRGADARVLRGRSLPLYWPISTATVSEISPSRF